MYALHARNLLAAKKLEDKLKTLNDLKKKLRDRKPSAAEIEANFLEIKFTNQITKQKKLVQYILAKIYSQHSSGVPIDYERMTIEHLAPQSPAGKSSVSDEHIGMIGNLILTDAALNAKLANKDFLAKRKLLENSRVWVDPLLKKATMWTDNEIEARAKALATLAEKTIWRI